MNPRTARDGIHRLQYPVDDAGAPDWRLKKGGSSDCEAQRGSQHAPAESHNVAAATDHRVNVCKEKRSAPNQEKRTIQRVDDSLRPRSHRLAVRIYDVINRPGRPAITMADRKLLLLSNSRTAYSHATDDHAERNHAKREP
ncbi:hypothetical protein EPN44_14430 [bacterium]|nr:MAG: hypothetical protein EPN44_14430 [bacterium]